MSCLHHREARKGGRCESASSTHGTCCVLKCILENTELPHGNGWLYNLKIEHLRVDGVCRGEQKVPDGVQWNLNACDVVGDRLKMFCELIIVMIRLLFFTYSVLIISYPISFHISWLCQVLIPFLILTCTIPSTMRRSCLLCSSDEGLPSHVFGFLKSSLSH